jgi:hypothetical protein
LTKGRNDDHGPVLQKICPVWQTLYFGFLVTIASLLRQKVSGAIGYVAYEKNKSENNLQNVAAQEKAAKLDLLRAI